MITVLYFSVSNTKLLKDFQYIADDIPTDLKKSDQFSSGQVFQLNRQIHTGNCKWLFTIYSQLK